MAYGMFGLLVGGIFGIIIYSFFHRGTIEELETHLDNVVLFCCDKCKDKKQVKEAKLYLDELE